MRNIFTHLFVVLLFSLMGTNAQAQFTSGKVYHFKNVENSGVALASSSLTDVAAVAVKNTSKNQLWYCEATGNYYTFRNLANGRYLSGDGVSVSWDLTDEKSSDTNLFGVYKSGKNVSLRSKAHEARYDAYGCYMHKDAGNDIVGWSPDTNGTLWTVEESTAYTIDDAYWAEITAQAPNSELLKTYQGWLEELFVDGAGACLTPKLGSLTEAQSTTAYKSLPTVLQKMVDKVYNNAWDEANAVANKPSWDADYAKRFRVQMYEPYSTEDEATLDYLKIYENSNMDNPTGIYANTGDVIYIMVEGEIADGSELWLTHQNGHGVTNKYNDSQYTKLHEGLNAVTFSSDYCQLWVAYVVHTYNRSGATIQNKFPEERKLSNYKPLKIHIHGGYINGFYNAIGDYRAAATETADLWGAVDNDEDWKYYSERVPLNGKDFPNRDFPLLGHRITLLFEYGYVTINTGYGMSSYPSIGQWLDNVAGGWYDEDYPNNPNCSNGTYGGSGTYDQYTGMGMNKSNGKINIIVEAWDRIVHSQYATMGLVSTATMDKMNSMYPRWTADNRPAENYNYGSATVNGETKTYKEFCRGIDYSEHFNHHAAAQGTYEANPTASYRHTNFPYYSLNETLVNVSTMPGGTWAPAHEIGHQNQGTINLQGQTEVTNNFFSNVAVWYMGMVTARYSDGQGSLENLLSTFNKDTENQYKQLAGSMALTHMYYRLWLYYHLAGHNTQFWPRLYELCRQVPLEDHPYGTNSGATTLLRFYKHACDAAGEDLTEFFRAHGYLDVMKGVSVGDYFGATYNQTQKQIDEAIAYVKNKKYPVNYAVLLINDGTSATTVKHNGVAKRALYDGSASAEMGAVNDFIAGNTSLTGTYTATLSGNTVTMSGAQGGVGFLVFNEEGELISFSNKKKFVVNAEAKSLLESGRAVISVIGSDSSVIAEVSLNDSATGIIGVTVGDGNADAENAAGKTIYDLQGRKLTKMARPGIYIVNQKKVLVK